jgi:hypothetical protein
MGGGFQSFAEIGLRFYVLTSLIGNGSKLIPCSRELRRQIVARFRCATAADTSRRPSALWASSYSRRAALEIDSSRTETLAG